MMEARTETHFDFPASAGTNGLEGVLLGCIGGAAVFGPRRGAGETAADLFEEIGAFHFVEGPLESMNYYLLPNHDGCRKSK